MKRTISDIFLKMKIATSESMAYFIVIALISFFILLFFSSVYHGSQLPSFQEIKTNDFLELILGITIVPVILAYLTIYWFGGKKPSTSSFYLLLIFFILFSSGYLAGAISGIFPYLTTKILLLPAIIAVYFVVNYLLRKVAESI